MIYYVCPSPLYYITLIYLYIMKQEGKIKAIQKIINTLVVPKVNELEPSSGFSIRSVKVGLTSYGERTNYPDFRITVDLTSEPKYHKATDGIAHLILNVAEYIDSEVDLTIDFLEWGSYFESTNVFATSRVFRKSNDESINMITNWDRWNG